ncbi:SAVMC3_10250 family protein [Streptomyces sp. NPDC050161]|uniref:SAVMC3_10250 family protein n=1 Tax=Streptomyces sp. NPDC050161 TaxID=3365604 RepID=UPI003798B66C
MPDLLYVAENKIYRRLGTLPPPNRNGELRGSLKAGSLGELSGARGANSEPMRNGDGMQLATLELIKKAARKIERDHSPLDFTDYNLRSNQWIRFDLDMALAAVHEDSGRPPEDVALFVGGVAAGTRDQTRDMGVLLCGSVQHLRTRAYPAGRMGSDSTWLHDLILEVERREDDGINVIPEFLSDIVPTSHSQERVEEIAHEVYGWLNRDYPRRIRSRMVGHAIVLMDIDSSNWTHRRLLVASPLYVEAMPQLPEPSSWARRLLRRHSLGR